MSLLLVVHNLDVKPWKEALLNVDANLDVEIWPNVEDKERVQFAVVWRNPPPVFDQFPNLKAVFSPGAGVDHILGEKSIPADIPVGRTVSDTLTDQMKEYLLTAVLNYQRNFYYYFKQQQKGMWNIIPDKNKSDFTIGVMGLGKIGKPVARQFDELGYKTAGWSKHEKRIRGVQTFAGDDELEKFLQQSTVLICLLPLTPQTEGILDLKVFKLIKHPGYLINVGRGDHLVEEDLIYALDKDWLEGAVLDVFSKEPLPERHPFWNRSSIMITPHISSLTRYENNAYQIIENYKRTLSGLPLKNIVNREKGY